MHEYKKILIVRFSSLGDAVLTIPVFNNLKSALPEAELVLLTKEPYASFFSNHPAVDRIITIGKKHGLLEVLGELRRERFDVMIDLHGNLRSRIVALGGNFGKIVTYKKDAFARRLLVLFRKHSPALQKHTLEKYLGVLPLLNIPVTSRTFSLAGSDTPPDKAQQSTYTVLVMQTAFLGDIVLTVPLLQSIKKYLPGHCIVCTTPQGADVFRRCNAADEIIVYDKHGAHRGIGSMIRLVRELRSRSIDIAVVPHRSLKSALMVFLAGIPRRIGFANSGGTFLFNHIVPFNWFDHDALRNLTLLFPLGIRDRDINWNISVAPAMESYVRTVIDGAGWDGSKTVIGINPGSVWPTKRWFADRFARAADLISEQWDAGIIIFGGMKDVPAASEVQNRMKRPVLNMCGKTNLEQLTALIARCDLFITNDSGSMHVAVSVDVPTIGIFGPTTRALGFFPYGRKHRVVETALNCRPCGLHGGKRCPKKHFECMNRITVEQVVSAAHEMLELRKAEKKAAGTDCYHEDTSPY